MRLSISHRTSYVYATPSHYTIQTLRLTPRREPHQHVAHWQIDAPGRLVEATDTYGNVEHTLTLTTPHRRLVIEARGEVEIDAPTRGRIDAADRLPPAIFLGETPLTSATSAVRTLAARCLPHDEADHAQLLDLTDAICTAVIYESGRTDVGCSAAAALSLGHGVCQDHAHLFVACCRVRAIPARYVSGYLHTGDGGHAATHAWADAWLPAHGWISVDVTHRALAGAQLCRLAVGRDYESAAPIRGLRVGGSGEQMRVELSVRSG